MKLWVFWWRENGPWSFARMPCSHALRGASVTSRLRTRRWDDALTAVSDNRTHFWNQPNAIYWTAYSMPVDHEVTFRRTMLSDLKQTDLGMRQCVNGLVSHLYAFLESAQCQLSNAYAMLLGMKWHFDEPCSAVSRRTDPGARQCVKDRVSRPWTFSELA